MLSLLEKSTYFSLPLEPLGVALRNELLRNTLSTIPSTSTSFAHGTNVLVSRSYANRRAKVLEVARKSQTRIRADAEHRRRLLASIKPKDDSAVSSGSGGSPPTPAAGDIHMYPTPPLSSEPSSLSTLTNHKTLLITRDIEWGNILLGFEQANKYVARDEYGTPVAYIAEEVGGLGSTIQRQILRTHRPMTATVLGTDGRVLFRVRRPFYWINSSLFIEDAEGRVLGEVQQRWHLLKRNYDVFIDKRQFAAISAPILAWQFDLRDEEGRTLAVIDRNFSGFAKELFTDAGKYAIHFGATADGSEPPPPALPPSDPQQAAAQPTLPFGLTVQQSQQLQSQLQPPVPIERPLTGLTERAIALATAISIDFDFFSNHSSGGSGFGGFIPIPFFGGGGSEPVEGDAGATEAPVPPADAPSPSSSASSGGGGWWGGSSGSDSAGQSRDSEELDDSGSFFGRSMGGESQLEGSEGEGDEDGVSWGDVMGSLGKLMGSNDDE